MKKIKGVKVKMIKKIERLKINKKSSRTENKKIKSLTTKNIINHFCILLIGAVFIVTFY